MDRATVPAPAANGGTDPFEMAGTSWLNSGDCNSLTGWGRGGTNRTIHTNGYSGISCAVWHVGGDGGANGTTHDATRTMLDPSGQRTQGEVGRRAASIEVVRNREAFGPLNLRLFLAGLVHVYGVTTRVSYCEALPAGAATAYAGVSGDASSP